MAEDRLKFRCYRCNQLLSASPKRVGTEISCPRCKAELVVPRINLEPAAAGEAPGRPGAAARPRVHSRSAVPGTFPPPIEEVASAIPEDLVALRPEDIRVEAEFVDLVVTTSEPERPVPPPVVDAL